MTVDAHCRASPDQRPKEDEVIQQFRQLPQQLSRPASKDVRALTCPRRTGQKCTRTSNGPRRPTGRTWKPKFGKAAFAGWGRLNDPKSWRNGGPRQTDTASSLNWHAPGEQPYSLGIRVRIVSSLVTPGYQTSTDILKIQRSDDPEVTSSYQLYIGTGEPCLSVDSQRSRISVNGADFRKRSKCQKYKNADCWTVIERRTGNLRK